MASVTYNLKLWSLQQHSVLDKDGAAVRYQEKETNATPTSEYYDIKKAYVTSRDGLWCPRNKRPVKLREQIKLVEDTLRSTEVVCVIWKHFDTVQLVFSTGLIVDIEVTKQLDIKRINFEKSLQGKLSTPACSAIYAEQFVCFSFNSQTKLAFLSLKNEVKVSYIELPGTHSKIVRYLSVNDSEDMMVCWWHHGPWFQTAHENEHHNMVLLGCSFGRLEVLSTILSENNLISLEFGHNNSNQILTLEKSVNHRKERHLDFVTYECSQNKMQRLSVISFPVKTGVLSSARSSAEDKVVVGCSDGSLTVYDLTIQQTVATVTRTGTVPTLLSWMSDVVVVGSAQGEVTLFDNALNSISFVNLEENASKKLELSQYISSGSGLLKIRHNNNGDMMLLFNGGPLAVLSLDGCFTTTGITKLLLANDNITQAVSLLCSINWNLDGEVAYQNLMRIVDHLLQLPLNHLRENQLEGSFSSFYASSRPISEPVVLKYRTAISCYARRFFHHLLRYSRFEKSFLLAKDIGSSDLFLDIYFAAKEVGETQLAKLAKQKADEIIAAESSESDSEGIDLNMLSLSGVNNQDSKDYLAMELMQEMNRSAEAGASTLKVTNLGFV
nr:WD repeat-containing and planar cell polarity effector protein fritz homolog [Ciona intestinalis]|eukprot:XP_009858683.2 WD repeat-containing and planar cell polarity effector protein fritz homolog [Ciona intestinalis]